MFLRIRLARDPPEKIEVTSKKKKLVKEGEGYKTPESGDEVEVHYTGTLLDGTKFDSASTGARLSNSLSDKVRLSNYGIFVSKQMRGYVWLDKAVKIKSESNGASWLAWKKEGEAISEETANFDSVSSSPRPEVTGSQTRHLLRMRKQPPRHGLTQSGAVTS